VQYVAISLEGGKMNIYDYPKIVEQTEHYIIADVSIKASICPKCGKFLKPHYRVVDGLYGNAMFNNPRWAENSYVMVDNYYICKECADKSLADFECALCNQRYPTSEIQESFGVPPEFLCKECYQNKPARIWCEKVEELESDHRYDFE